MNEMEIITNRRCVLRMFRLCLVELSLANLRGTLVRQVVARLAVARAISPAYTADSIGSIHPGSESSGPAQAGRKREESNGP